MVHDSQAHVEQGERAAESPASVTAAATLLEMTSTKPEGGIRLAKLEHQVDEPEQILNNLPTKVELTFEQRSRLSEQNLRFINSRNLIMAAPVQAGSQGAEAFDKTQRDRGMFERGIGAASHESYCSQLFASASNPEITKFVAESLDGKTIVNLGGGNAKIAHELRESHGVQVDMKNIEPYASERALQDPDSDPIISANPAEANFFETSGLDQHSQDEVWAEYSVPAYLGTAEEITNLFDNIQKLLKPEGIARIGHCGLVTGENNEGRRQALIDSLKAAADKGYLIEAVDVNSKLTLLMTAPLDVAR